MSRPTKSASARAPRRLARLGRDRRGTSALEFAIVAPVFIGLLYFILAVGHTIFQLAAVQWALERSARDLMLDADMSATQIEKNFSDALGELTDITVQFAYSEDDSGTVPMTRVKADITVPIDVPLVGSLTVHRGVESWAPRPTP